MSTSTRARRRKPKAAVAKTAAAKTVETLVSTVTARGQTTIPGVLRKKLAIDKTTRLEWMDDGEMLLVVPVPADPIERFRGKSRATLTLNLLRDRKVQRRREG